MAIAFTKQDKAKAVSILRDIARHMLYHGVTPENQKLIEEHLAYLDQQGEDLTIECEFQTAPEIKSTRFVVTTYVGKNLAGIKQ